MLRFANRYLSGKGSHTVVNIISRVSLISIAVPVAAMVLLLSIFNGFGDLAKELTTSLDADLTLQSSRGRLFDVADVDTAKIKNIEGVELVSLSLEQMVLLKFGDREVVTTLKGVEAAFMEVTPFAQSVVVGEPRVEFGDLDRLIVGYSIAHQLGVNSLRGAHFAIYTIGRGGGASFLPISSYRREEVALGALFQLDTDTEARYALTSLRFMQRALRAENKASELYIKLSTPQRGAAFERVRRDIQEVVGDGFTLKSRFEINPMMHTIVQGEKRMITIVGVLVMLLASFTLVGAVTMLTIDKQGEFTVLRSLGASRDFIRGIFILSGVLISAVGSAIGVVVGVVLSLAQQWGGFVKLPTGGLLFDVYPVRLLWWDVLLVTMVSMLISSLISVVVVRLNIRKV